MNEPLEDNMLERKVLVVVPAYNEEANIQSVIDQVKKTSPKWDICVVDDGSTDQTKVLSENSGVTVVSLVFNLGIGGAMQTGFLYALRHGYDIVVQCDGDGQHDPDFIEKICQPIVQNEADLVIGSRFRPPYLGYRSSWVRRIGIHFFANLISGLTACSVTDPTSGFRAYNRRCFEIFIEHYPIDFPEPESIVTARQFGLKVIEIPVEMRKRAAGHSSIRYFKTLYYMIKVTCAILLDMTKGKKEATK